MILDILYLLILLMVVNFVIGLLRGVWTEGFNKEKFAKGLTTYLLVLIGFTAIALFAFYASQKSRGFMYLVGILVDPIARYLVKLLDTLRELLDWVFGRKSKDADPKHTAGTVAEAAANGTKTVTQTVDGTQPVKRKRGRPRKYPLPEEANGAAGKN